MENTNWLDPKILRKYVEHSKFTVEKHPAEDLYIYGYYTRKPGSEIVWDKTNINLRGAILDGEGYFKARPFDKFFTFKEYLSKDKVLTTEGTVVNLPKVPYRIYEKLDGSMTMLYWAKNEPSMASQRSFVSPNAQRATSILRSKYSHLYKSFNRDYTYVFEAIYPETKVLVDYGNDEKLVLIGIIETKTGRSVDMQDFQFEKALDFTKAYGNITDLEELRALNLPNVEGFVLHYDNGLRLKIKFPWFSEAHHLMNRIIHTNKTLYETRLKFSGLMGIENPRMSNMEVWRHMKNGTIEQMLKNVPEEFYAHSFEIWLQDELAKLNAHVIDLERSKGERELSNIDWENIKPAEEKFFSVISNSADAKYSTPMWNLLNRIKDEYL